MASTSPLCSSTCGLYLQVNGTDRGAWVFIYKRGGRQGQQRVIGLGSARHVKLKEARQLADACRAADGIASSQPLMPYASSPLASFAARLFSGSRRLPPLQPKRRSGPTPAFRISALWGWMLY